MAGADKAEAVLAGVTRSLPPLDFPVCGVEPSDEGSNSGEERLIWMIEESCAKGLKEKGIPCVEY